MDKRIETKVEQIKVTHEFYCNHCNKFLGRSVEHEDGWYDEKGDVSYVVKDSVDYVGHLCESCKKELDSKLLYKQIEILKNYGIKPWNISEDD